LAPGGRVLTFQADAIPVRPGSYPEAYVQALEAGTCIKLWNYKFPGKLRTLATLDLRHALEPYLPEPALPIRVIERRPGYRANFYDTTMSGLIAVLEDKPDDIEPGFDTGSPLGIPDVGEVTLRLVVVKEQVAEYFQSGVFFVVNGQLHSEISADSMARRARLDYLEDTLIAIVDCSSLPLRVREDLFLASRDRMRQCPERTALEQAVFEYLKEHPGLKDLNARRRQARIGISSTEDTTNVFQALVRSDSTLASLFGRGNEIRLPQGPLPEPEPYVGRQFPTYFRLAREPRGGLVRKCPRNRSCRIEFETDAANDYFTRANEPGHLESRGTPIRESIHLWNGKAVVRYSLPDSSNVGDRLRVHVTVSDTSRVNPFEAEFTIEVEEEIPPSPTGSDSTSTQSSRTGVPKIQEVRRADWSRHSFDEHSGISIKHGEDDSLDIFVNMDNIYLRNEIARRRAVDPTALNNWFKYGLSILAIGMLHRMRQENETSDQDADDEAVQRRESDVFSTIEMVSRGLAVTIVPVIAQLNQISQTVARVNA
jgi:hypothetical protein